MNNRQQRDKRSQDSGRSPGSLLGFNHSHDANADRCLGRALIRVSVGANNTATSFAITSKMLPVTTREDLPGAEASAVILLQGIVVGHSAQLQLVACLMTV